MSKNHTHSGRGENRLDWVKSHYDLAEMAMRYGVELSGRNGGRYMTGACPIHRETEPSFFVYTHDQRYYCYGCGAHGDVINFVQALENFATVKETLDFFRTPDFRKSALDKPLPAPGAPEAPQGPYPGGVGVINDFAKAVHGILADEADPDGAPGRQYLASRGLDAAAAATKLRLGYIPRNRVRPLIVQLREQYGADAVRDAGILIYPDDPGRNPYCRFTNRIIVPEFDLSGAYYLAARALDPDAKPRFQGLPGPKPVLGLAKIVREKQPWCILTEGLFDYIALKMWDWPVCAIMGASGIKHRPERFEDVGRIIVAFDSDGPGEERGTQRH